VKALGELIIGPPDLFRLHFNRAGSAQAIPWQATVEFVGVLAGLLLVAILASRIVNVNRFSLHGMYRNRLVRAYLGASNCAVDGVEQRTPDPFTGFALNENLPLHKLCSPPATPGPPAPAAQPNPPAAYPKEPVQAPLSIINTTLNLVNGQKLAWQQRKAESFSMSPLFCGSWLEGYRKSTEYGGPGGVTVGTAVTPTPTWVILPLPCWDFSWPCSMCASAHGSAIPTLTATAPIHTPARARRSSRCLPKCSG
jgi:hypothetical protein